MPAALRPLALAAALPAALAACGGDATSPAVTPGTSPTGGGATFSFTRPADPSPSLAGRGALTAASAGPPVSRTLVAALVAAEDAGRAFAARYDVQPYAITYQTVGVDGALTSATGALYLPVGATGPLPIVVYQHGTVTSRTAVPSQLASGGEGQLIGAAYAADGFAVVLPDYLGYGGSTAPYHPYLHAATEASAAADLLRAAVQVAAAKVNAALDPRQVFVTGYSEGGHAAAALQRALERDYAGEFTVRALAPMSGPYDLSGTGARLLAANPAYGPSVVYGALLGASMAKTYALAPNLSAVFVPPNDATAGALVAGAVSSAQLSTLPSQLRAEFQPALLTALAADSAHPFWRALRDNDELDWAPRAPTRLYFGSADRDVDPSNAPTAAARMRTAGATNVAAVSVGAFNHAGAVVPATVAGRIFFDSVRAGLVK